ncbi:site-specific DNA-methyltransferase [Helicobacter pylori]|uniref:site-specific DNA-methyltransferase n=1 Tax=Helicobacter pylori TaxID=210 RepID=UPI0018D12425|nr:site-specific DNA-methyltransferase [Helicobacter pylori]MBH0278350.1 site-specific DNA-methyltransferase [Helicobacter pylori]MBH0281200.1 site-specific DNA-methyltransferase [Helicobacter pylori]MBH0284192.1 site-specific DNA-methyltransferase [Helicobacter pylori]
MLKNPLKTLVDILINHFTKERLVTLILQHDEKLLIFMLEHENANDYKNAFFKTIANTLVFNEKALLECLEIKELEKSFTRFKNKIGLYSQGGLIKSSELVVLNFPFKDNVLLGNAKDNSTKPNELFYHEILHKKEIDTLSKKKALCHFEMHGEGDLESALKDRNTNYLIKGNNLIALHSLKKKFAKQVKCIYIDPPYNTGNDSFNYNDNFNHSSWLVFMKNRLEAAREFLSDDGVIFVQCDDNEQAYLKVLMDEIFGRENFVNTIIWEKKYSPQNDAKWFSDNHDFILLYAKDKGIWRPNLLPRTSEMNARYKNLDNDERGAWKPSDCLVKTYMASYDYPITTPSGKVVTPPKGRCWMTSKENFQKLVDDNRIYFGRNGDNVPSLKRFLSEVKQGTTPLTIWKYTEVGHNQDATKQLLALFNNVKLFDTPKPEALLQRILEISTKENDLVCDFFAGSGTTCAVAHKMKRRYIGIEQMDYIETITKERLKKVIEGEQGGISKKCDFKGGGSFVYAELKEVNLEIKKQILNAKSKSECLKIFNDLNERFLKRADCKIGEIHSEEFHNLDLNEQKRICCNLLDSNEDYLNLGDIDEDAWEIDEITKKYNEIFYS